MKVNKCNSFSAAHIQTGKRKLIDKEVLIKSEDIKGERFSLDSLNNTDGDTIVDLFEKQAQKTPDEVAVIFDNEQLSYRQLDILSNQLAHYLRNLGVKEENLVPICMERSMEMIIGIFGILKAGAAYVPIDPYHPGQRITDILKETEATLILTQHKIRNKITVLKDQLSVLEWEEIKETIKSQPEERTTTNLTADHLAYVIFTSGSTGKPKGILIEHNQLVSSTLARNSYYKDLSSILLIPSFAFDASVGPIFGSLTKGYCLILSSLEALQDSQQLPALLGKSKTIICVPSYYKFLLDEDLIVNSEVNTVIVGGEPLGQELVNAHFRLGKTIALFNEYGPTETTVWATVSKIESNETPISIGSPIVNAQAYILNESGSLLPEGEVGELHIGGKGLARGYLNNPKLTQEKFVDNPFGNPGLKMYKTGDLCYWLPDKEIAYVGRLDEQVKISGHRIELGEIETAIGNSGSVKETVVITKELENGEKQLIAYIVPKSIFDQENIVKYLKDRLPSYMVPSLWKKLERLPLTVNGKIDKQALRKLDINHIKPNFEGARDHLEQAMLNIWQKLLHLDQVSIYDDFFALGGNSLLAMRAVAAIRKEMVVEVSLKDIFSFPIVAHLVDHLRSTQKSLPDPVLNVSPRPPLTPLSFGQESLWFIDQLEGSVSYHLPLVFNIQGEVNEDALAASLKRIVERHEVLRTVITEREEGKTQHVLSVDKWALSLIKEERLNENGTPQQEIILELLQKPFDLSSDYLFKATLIQIDQQEHLLVLIFHHIVFDAWSSSVFIKELFLLYQAYTESNHPTLKPVPVQYADYAIWQREQFRKNLTVQKLAYWKEKLKGWTPLQLPTDFPRPASPTTRGAVTQFVIEQRVTDEIKELSQNQGTTLYMTLLAAFKILLYRYSSQEDICVGTTIAGRQQAETENLIGYFVNTLALRSRVNPNGSFLELLHQTKTNVLEAFENEEVPFDQVVAEAGVKRERYQNPLFQVMFLFQDTERTSLRWEGTTFTQIEAPQPTSKFDLTFSITQTSEGLTGNIEYRTELFRSETMEKMKGHYTNLLRSLVKDHYQCIGKIDILSPEEKHRLLVEFNNTKVAYPKGKTLVDLIEEQVLETPFDTAFVFENKKITFFDLDKKANQLAHLLREKGVKEETFVLICMERSLEMIVGILGILKAGGAYVPLDPEYPQERIRFIQEDTRANIAVSSRTSQSKLQQLESLDIINLEEDGKVLEEKSREKIKVSIQPHHLAYIIYTSGSTGTPKGVMIEHRNVYSFISWCKDEFHSSHFKMVYAATSICFDLSVFEIFYPLISGKPARILENGLQISETVHRDDFVMINTVPGVVQNLLNERADLSNVSLINMAGEPVPLKVLKELDTEKIETRNLYGPSEDTTYSTIYRFDKEKHLLIGKPISNTTIYILNSQNQLCPEGIPGEIFIGGSGLARGYLNREDLTSERFVADPFSADADARMYKTGDFGRWVQNGQIEYLGRNDDQVKIRGFRIELGEIERVLQQCEGVQQAVVLAQDDHQNNKQLIGYVVPNDIFDRKSIVNFLRHKLPSYMIPSIWVKLAALPLTPNGKINKKELPKPDIFGSLEKEHVPPQTKTELDLAEIWKKLLNIEHLGTEDNFFELGGHSLLAISLVMAIRKHFEVDLEIKDLFDFPTIAGLAAKLQWKLKIQSLPAIQNVSPRPKTVPLSYSQESLWFIDQLEGSIQYHVPIILEIEGLLDEKALTQALKKVVERHEVLRTVIHHQGGNPAQYVLDYTPWELSVIQGNKEDNGSKTSQLFAEIINEPFDLAKDFLFRASLVRFDAQQHFLVLTLHHIAADGWSLPILIDEIGRFYQIFQKGIEPGLSPLPIQFADYALWQRKHINEDYLNSKANYWRTKLQDLPSLELLTDYPRPETPSMHGTAKEFVVERLLLDQLILTSKQQGITLFMLLLAACKVLLHRYSKQEDICVGTATAGRQQQEIQNLIGYFINPLPLRTIVDKKASFQDFLVQVKTVCLEAFENQDMPFEKIVTSVGAERKIGRNPLFQVMFILQNLPPIHNLDFGAARISQKNHSSNTSKFDLTFSITETDKGLEGTVEYATDLFMADTINHMITGYVELLKVVAFNPFIKIEDIDLSSFSASAEIGGVSNSVSSSLKKKKGRALKESAQKDKTLKHVPATTPEEKLVAKIWGQSLGIKKVNIVDNFFEIGGHSLIAVQVMTRLEKESGVKLPLSILFKYPTVQKLALILKSKEKEANKWNSLVPIKPLGNKTPLYIIHGAGLNVLPFYSIANNMDPEQPVYGLQAKGLNGIDEPLTSVEAMASHYIDEIVNHNPKGPYALAGYSFGGVLAFEMAKQLRASGKEVKELILFDTYVYDSDHKKNWLVKFTNKILYSVGKRVNDIKLLINHPDIFKSVKITSLKRKKNDFLIFLNLKERPQEPEILKIIKKIEGINKEASKNYLFSKYDDDIYLLRAKIRTNYIKDPIYLGWKPYVGKVNIIEVEGKHTTMFSPPHALQFAQVLQDILDGEKNLHP